MIPASVFSQISAALPRVVVPLIVAWLTNLALVKQLGMTDDQLTNAVSLAVAALYWLLVRVFEVYVSPKFSRLLGTRSSAVMVKSDDPQLFTS